jgi:NhaP-type Na+/H+ or K+/H+ antiporter
LVNAEQILLLISFTIILAYIAGIFYNRTRIPDLVWLLGFGVLMGPLLGIFDESLFGGIFDLMLLVAVTMFSFSTGISINAQELLGKMRKAMGLAVASFFSITAAVGGILRLVAPETFSLVEAFLLGAMVAGMSGVSVSSLASSMGDWFKNFGESMTLLQLESTLGAPIRVVAVVTLIEMAALTGAGPKTAARDILFLFLTSVTIGASFGLVWGEILSRLRDRPLNYMMTIAALFPVYVFSEWVSGGGGGPVSVFLVGFTVMNFGFVTKRLGVERRARVDRRKLRGYYDELTFLIKALLFFYLGIVVKPSVESLRLGLTVSAVVIVVRFLAATLVGEIQGFEDGELFVTRLIYIQGAGTLVLSQFPVKYDAAGVFFSNPGLFTNVCVPVVLVSLIYNSAVSPLLARHQLGSITRVSREPTAETGEAEEDEDAAS